MIAIALALLVAAPVPQFPAPAAEAVSRPLTDGELRGRIDGYLRAIDVEIEPAQWQALGTRALPLLEEIARDRSQLPTRRAQALSALGFIGGPRAAAVLAELSAREEEPAGVRMAAVRGLGAASAPGDLEATLRPLLQGAGDARVRAVAAEQLVERLGDGACATVKARAAGEPASARSVFARALAACAAR